MRSAQQYTPATPSMNPMFISIPGNDGNTNNVTCPQNLPKEAHDVLIRAYHAASDPQTSLSSARQQELAKVLEENELDQRFVSYLSRAHGINL
ncbi:MAG: hypothetical protein AAGJ35_07485 [Myxococcota bacterium]